MISAGRNNLFEPRRTEVKMMPITMALAETTEKLRCVSVQEERDAEPSSVRDVVV